MGSVPENRHLNTSQTFLQQPNLLQKVNLVRDITLYNHSASNFRTPVIVKEPRNAWNDNTQRKVMDKASARLLNGGEEARLALDGAVILLLRQLSKVTSRVSHDVPVSCISVSPSVSSRSFLQHITIPAFIFLSHSSLLTSIHSSTGPLPEKAITSNLLRDEAQLPSVAVIVEPSYWKH